MKKKIIMGACLIWASLLGVFSLSASGNRVEVISQSHAIRQTDGSGNVVEGLFVNNTINMEKSDLVNGNVAIEITVDNSLKTEVMYVIDNSTLMSSTKSNIIDSFKTNANELESMDNITQGIVTTNENGEVVEIGLDSTNINDQLESIKNINPSNTADIFTSIEKAATYYSSDTNRKIMIIALSQMPTNITGLKDKIDELMTSGIRILVYGINVNNTTNFKNVFDSANIYEITTNTISNIDFETTIKSMLPKERPVMALSISFDNYILNNFNIDTTKIESTNGVAHYDASTNEIIWEIGKVGTNKIVKLNYVLSLKQAVDPTFIGKTLRTSRQIKIIESGIVNSSPEDYEIEDKICSPTIRILQEAVDNPKTGVASYVAFGACLLIVSGITIVALNRKSGFNRI